MKVKKMSSFVSVEDVKNDDILIIEDEGEWNEDGKYGAKLVIKVQLPNNEVKKLSLNTTSYNTLISEFGEETNDWIKKEVRVHILQQKVGSEFKDVIYLSHPNKNLKGEEVNA